jgi:squalene-hopene/tetraprenyl-beta-curcumene cyclase
VQWLREQAGGTDPASLRRALNARYGDDRTFAGPILMMCALCGRFGDPAAPATWRDVPQLPFELAAAPPRLFKLLDLTVVSYALPALICIGLVRHRHAPTRIAPLRWLRTALTPRLLSVVARMQPTNGGFEEAAPLTAFVAMSLAASGFPNHAVVQQCCAFLTASQRADGALPIDTDLATWVTVLSVNALTASGGDVPRRDDLLDWLLAQQHRQPHPLTFGAPGGWGWSDLPGAMPDADDTAGTLLACRRLWAGEAPGAAWHAAAAAGLDWLLALQNRDGGIPTFSRGWGKLPFDRSCCDITAHVLQACAEWLPDIDDARRRRRMHRAMGAMVRYLGAHRIEQGWSPLWFGSQQHASEENPVHGTARALLSLHAADAAGTVGAAALAEPGTTWLLGQQGADGGWGATGQLPCGIEETGLAVAALCHPAAGRVEQAAARRGLAWLADRTEGGRATPAAPIGLYFARLWYAERLYPLIFSQLAFARAAALGLTDRAS